MKTLIIPDIHTGFVRAESIITDEEHDKVLFLGDYFDAFGDTQEDIHQTAIWLKDSLTKQNRIHLLGNHDLAYLDQHYPCSGFTNKKLFTIKSTGVDLSKLQHYYFLGDWLCTHAGLSNEFFKAYARKNESVVSFLNRYISDEKLKPRLYDCSPSRGGRDAYSGIVWCDYEEFVDIPNIKQIFGHTYGDLRQSENHICLDTGIKNYAIYDSESKLMIVAEVKHD